MKISVRIIAAAAALAACGLASAQSAGSWMARVGVTHLSPDVSSGNLSAPSFPNTKVDAGSNTQLGGGITYMVTDNLALDVPLATPFKHDLSGAGAIAGVGKLGSTKAIPATLMLQYRFTMGRLFDVPPGAFRPAPKVMSSIVRMVPRPVAECTASDEALLGKIVTAAFGQRRKTLRNTLRDYLDEAGFAALGIDPGLRGERLSVADFVRIANHVAQQGA